MKEYKIVKFYTSPEDSIYRVFKRKYLFLWEHATSYHSLTDATWYVQTVLANKEKAKQKRKAIPKPELVMFL